MNRTKTLLGITLVLNSVLLLGQTHNYSSPFAPIGDKTYTVPECTKPVLDEWMRDAFVMKGPDNTFYMVGTTASKDREFAIQPHCWDYNDGFYMWKSKDLMQWDTVGLIWSYDRDATWQKAGKPIKPGSKSVNGDPLDSISRAAWAPELHYIKSKNKWLLVGCQNGGAGSFILESTTEKPEGPYKNIKGNETKALFPNIDLSLFEDDNGDVYAVGHNHYIAKMKPDLSDIAEPFKRFIETPYLPEPYIEGVYLVKQNGKYVLLQTVWSLKNNDGSYTYCNIEKKKGNELIRHSYDVVISTSDNIYGPYSERIPAIVEGGHNNLFQDTEGQWWSTLFFNPRGVMGTRFNPTCRASYIAVKWENGQLKPDIERTKKFFSQLEAKQKTNHLTAK